MLRQFPMLGVIVLAIAVVAMALIIVYVWVISNALWAVLALVAAIVVMSVVAKLRQPPPVA